MKNNNKDPNLESFEKRVDKSLQGNQKGIPQEKPLAFYAPNKSGAETPEEGNSEVHVAEKGRGIVKTVSKIVGGVVVAGLVAWGGLTYYQNQTNKQLEREKIVEIARADSAKASELTAKILAGENLALAERADSIRRADSSAAAAKLAKKQKENERLAREKVEFAKKAQISEDRRIDGYIKFAQTINPDLKIRRDGKNIRFDYVTVDKSGKLNYSMRERVLPISHSFWGTSDSLTMNVTRAKFVKDLLDKKNEVPGKEWYQDLIDGKYDRAIEISGREAKEIFGEGIEKTIKGYSDNNQYALQVNNGSLRRYATIRSVSEKPDYSTIEQKVQEGFKIELGNSEAAKDRMNKLDKIRGRYDPDRRN